MFVDWFTRNFTTTVAAYYDPQAGYVGTHEEIYWPALKAFFSGHYAFWQSWWRF